MKFKDYESSNITPQCTLLKKFNKVLEYLRNKETIKIYKVSYKFNGRTYCECTLHSKDEIYDYNSFKENANKFVFGYYEDEEKECPIVAMFVSETTHNLIIRYFTGTDHETLVLNDTNFDSVEYLGDL